MKPVLQALLLAEKVYEDGRTRQKVIAGTFNALRAGKIPVEQRKKDDGSTETVVPGGMQAGSPWVYISLTEVRGDQRLVLRYVSLQDNKILMHCDVPVSGQDPLQTHELAIPLPMLPTPHEGVYALELLCNEEPIGSLRVTVLGLTDGEEE